MLGCFGAFGMVQSSMDFDSGVGDLNCEAGERPPVEGPDVR